MIVGWLLALPLVLPLALAPVGKTGASYDAALHRIEARGAAAADPRAPSAEVARVRAERQARVEAANRLGKALSALGWRGDEASTRKLLEAATASDVDYGADGSVTMTLSLSTEGVALTPRH